VQRVEGRAEQNFFVVSRDNERDQAILTVWDYVDCRVATRCPEGPLAMQPPGGRVCALTDYVTSVNAAMAIPLLSCVIDRLDAKSARPVDVDANQRLCHLVHL